MAEESIRLVESAFEAWNRRDIDGFAEHTSKNVAWVEVAGRPEGIATERVGRERMRQSLWSLFDAFESYQLEIERMREVGDRLLLIVREVARGRASGLEVASQWGYLITVANGEMTRIEAYRDASVALEAAGLGESEVGAQRPRANDGQ